MSEKAIELKHVGMKFNLSKEKVDSLKDYLIKSVKREMEFNEFWALKDVSFSIEKGGPCRNFGTEWCRKEYIVKSNCRRF